MNEVEEVKARLDIAEVIGQYVPLQRAGRSFKAPCPFHSEKTPSFIVSPDRQSWHCFGACATGGDVISFVMKKEGIDFVEALRTLAARAGVTLPERRRRPEDDERRERVHAANEAAARWFHDLLLNSEAGKGAWEYLQGRSVDTATAQAFLLGYSPQSWDATREHLNERGFSDSELMAAGLLVEGERGPHDRFRGRLMFPIRDAKGRFAGFGARALDDTPPKYLNTAQTELFDKGGMLYALDRAQDAIRQAGQVVVVEGYMDVIAAHQSGFENVVATMGTSLTERQVRLLKRQTRNVVLALDADAAGSEAALRGHEVVEEALKQGDERETVPVVTWRGLVRYQDAAAVELKVAVLPEGRDPDDVIRADPEGWRSLIASALPVLDYRFQAVSGRHDVSTPRGRSEAVQELLPLLEPLSDPVVRAHYLQRLSRLSLLSEADLSKMASRRKQPAKNVTNGGPAPLEDKQGETLERYLLALLLSYEHLRETGETVPEELLWESANKELLGIWKSTPQIDRVKEAVPAELEAHFQRLLLWRLPEMSPKQAEAALLDCLRRLQRRQHTAQARAMTALLAEKEETLGSSALIEAAVSGDDSESDEMREGVGVLQSGQEIGLKIHGIERKVENGNDAERTVDG